MPSPPVMEESKLNPYGESESAPYMEYVPELPFLYQSWTSLIPFASLGDADKDTAAVVVYCAKAASCEVGFVLSRWSRKLSVYVAFLSTSAQSIVLKWPVAVTLTNSLPGPVAVTANKV